MTNWRHAVRTFAAPLLAPVLAFLVLAGWAVSSPVASSPDDNFHLAAIWCGLGDRDGLCESPPEGGIQRLVPAPLNTATCYATVSTRSAACWDPSQPGMTQVERANVDGLYPRVFYAVMSVFASSDVPASVMVMRLLNCLIAVGVLTAAFWALPRWLRPALVLSVVVTGVPLGLFILASTNPSSWAMLSAATVWITMYGALRTDGRRRIVLLALTGLGVVLGAGARADAAVYAAFGVVLAMLLGLRRDRRPLVPLLVAVAAMVVCIAFYLSAWQGSAVVSGLESDNPPLTTGQILQNVVDVPLLWVGALGNWPLGWNDTPMPPLVWVLATVVFAGAVFVGIRRPGLRRMLGVVLAFAAVWAVPLVLLVQSRAQVGELVQPRYILPLMVIAVGVASARSDAVTAWCGARAAVAATALTMAFAVALHTNITRYTTGNGRVSFDPGAGAEWWWAGAPAPIVVWIGGTVAFAALCAMLWFAARQAAAVTDAATDGLEPRDAGPVAARPAAS